MISLRLTKSGSDFLYRKGSDRKLEYLAEVLERVKLSNGMIPLISYVVFSVVGLRHDKSCYDACKKYVKLVDHISLDRIDPPT